MQPIRLSNGDHNQVSAFLRELYSQADCLQLPDVIIRGLFRLIPCEHIGYNEINSTTNETFMVMYPHCSEVFRLAPSLEAHFNDHPILAHYRRTCSGTACKTTDVISARQFRQLGIYRDFYRHVDTENQLGCLLSEPGDQCDIAIGINRKRSDFTVRDRSILEFVRPHMAQARLNAIAFTEATRKTRALTETLDSMDTGLIGIAREGRIAWMTPRAAVFLERYFPGAGKHTSQLPNVLDRWRHSCERALKSTPTATLGAFVIRLPDAQLTVRCKAEGPGLGRLLLTEQLFGAARINREAFGLTVREAEVLHWIAQGKSNPEIGTILGLSSRTVDKHTQHILAKLGVETRTAAARIALGG